MKKVLDVACGSKGMWFDKNPERDLDIEYKGENYVITIKKMEV